MPNLASGVRGNFLGHGEGQFLRFIDPASLSKRLHESDGGSLSLDPVLLNAAREEAFISLIPMVVRS